MPDDRRPELRVGDREREAVAEQLREHYAQGRLSHPELDSRLEACMAARTQADLQPLLADLPAPAAPGHPPAGRTWPGPWRHWLAVSVVVWAIWAVALATGSGSQGLWPLWVSGPWGAVLLSRTIRGPDDPFDEAKRRAHEERRVLREARRARRDTYRR